MLSSLKPLYASVLSSCLIISDPTLSINKLLVSSSCQWHHLRRKPVLACSIHPLGSAFFPCPVSKKRVGGWRVSRCYRGSLATRRQVNSSNGAFCFAVVLIVGVGVGGYVLCCFCFLWFCFFLSFLTLIRSYPNRHLLVY